MIGKAVLGSFLALSSSPVLALDEPSGVINLICAGASTKDETVGTTLDLLGGQGRTERIDIEDSISFVLNPDNTGTARLPRRLQSAYKEPNKDGSFTIVKLARNDTEITGQVRLHSMYKMRLRLDRLTGIVTLTGGLGNFTGRCEAYDPATVVRKF